MNKAVNLSCDCGTTEWRIDNPNWGRHVKCYCADCQSFVQHLGTAEGYLDGNGTQLFQTTPNNIAITKGEEQVALMRLSPNGLFRWYAKCCNTPIANTLTTPGMPFCGMVLPKETKDFGPIKAHLNTDLAQPARPQKGLGGSVSTILSRAFATRLTGKGRQTPFFNPDGTPAVDPRVISLEERQAARPES